MEENKEIEKSKDELLEGSIFRPQNPSENEKTNEISKNDEDIKEEPKQQEIEQTKEQTSDEEAQEQKDLSSDEKNIDEKTKEDEAVKEAEKEAEKEQAVEELMDEVEKNQQKADNSPLKKYLFYVSKDFTPIIDSMTIDKRTAYINEAIQMKIDSTKINSQNDKIHRIIFQAIMVFLTVCIATPLAVFIMNKAIMLTFDNYKYSQHNFEKLYKQRFESDRAYMRSVQYNKAYQELNKKK